MNTSADSSTDTVTTIEAAFHGMCARFFKDIPHETLMRNKAYQYYYENRTSVGICSKLILRFSDIVNELNSEDGHVNAEANIFDDEDVSGSMYVNERLILCMSIDIGVVAVDGNRSCFDDITKGFTILHMIAGFYTTFFTQELLVRTPDMHPSMALMGALALCSEMILCLSDKTDWE